MQDIIFSKKQILYPSFNTRIFAALIDNIFLFLALAPILKIINSMIYDNKKIEKIINSMKYDNNLNMIIKNGYNLLIDCGLIYNLIIQIIIALVIFVFCWSGFSTTPGKKLFSLIIVDQYSLKKPSVKQSIIRFLSYIISILLLFLGIFWIIFSKKKQAWHDKIAKTIVIKK